MRSCKVFCKVWKMLPTYCEDLCRRIADLANAPIICTALHFWHCCADIVKLVFQVRHSASFQFLLKVSWHKEFTKENIAKGDLCKRSIWLKTSFLLRKNTFLPRSTVGIRLFFRNVLCNLAFCKGIFLQKAFIAERIFCKQDFV